MLRAFRLVAWPFLLLWAIDLVVALAAILLGLSFSYAELTSLLRIDGPFSLQIILFALPVSFYLFVFGAYSKRAIANFKVAISYIFISHFAVFCTLAALFYFLPPFRIWQSAMLPALLASLLFISLVHFAFDRLVSYRFFRRKIFVLGHGKSLDRLEGMIRSGRFPMIEVVGLTRIASDKAEKLSDKTRAMLDLDRAAAYSLDEIVLAFDDRRKNLPADSLLGYRLRGIQISQVSSFLEREQGRVDIDDLQPSWMLFAAGFTAGQRFESFLKRLFDIVTSLAILLLTAPLTLLAALAVWLQDFASPFYAQERVGRNGKLFKLYKLRTMHPKAEEQGVAVWSNPGDNRVTPVGRLLRRTRIDELPQLLNVLQGHMSLIGPRPERPEFVVELKRRIPFFDYRHVVKPGLSGWAQLNYPYGSTVADAKEKLAYDLFYIKNYSWMLDLVILLQTIRVVMWPLRPKPAIPFEAGEKETLGP